ncbi:electron transport complex subunit RsxC [Endothiovibrio diazotrophicus]
MGSRQWRFHGGIHLPENKEQSNGRAVEPLAMPRELVLPLGQHIGAEAEPMVQAGERVLKGQMIAKPKGYVSAPLHAPTSGTVVAVTERPVPHPSQLPATCIVIEPDGEDRWIEHAGVEDWSELPAETLHELIRNAGIVGLGGAGFPTFIKLNQGKPVEMLILNGAECEPFITCDDRLMRERADEVVEGARIMLHALAAPRCLIGIEDNKLDAHQALVEAVAAAGVPDSVEVVSIPTLYPTGGEKQLIKVLTGREVPSQGLPLQVGVVCQNVATAAAVYRAVRHGEPLISRIVTVTGAGVHRPTNLEVPFGAPMGDLVAHCGGYTKQATRLVMGGPMMGLTLPSDELPVIKTANCVLVASHDEMPEPAEALACIRCGRCAEVCPAQLLPQQLYWHTRAKDFDKAQDYSLFDCIECGCCAYVCPSRIPLVQYYRYAKTEIWGQERDKRKADLARQRHEARQARIRRAEEEKAARMAKKQAALADSDNPASVPKADDAKKAAIEAALARAKAKKTAAGIQPKNTDNLTAEQQRQIDEADARRASDSNSQPPTNGS